MRTLTRKTLIRTGVLAVLMLVTLNEANAKDKAGQKAAFDKMLALVPDVKEGQTLTFTYVPGKGTTLRVGDKELGAFEGKGFAGAVFSIWLGAKPPSEDLKKGMLGG